MSINTTRQFWIHEPGRGGVVTRTIPGPGEGEVLVRARYSGISRGTEALVFRGEVPPTQFAAMRAPFQEGDFPAPVKYGYMSVGDVVETGPGVEAGLAGATVFCLYPHQDRYVVPARAVRRVPAEVPAGRAVLAANVETALNAVWDGRPGPGDRIVVVGGGVVGLLIAWLCGRLPAAQVTVVDPNPARRSVAESLGVDWAGDVPADADADLVFHASGNPAGLGESLAACGVEGTVIEVSWFGDRPVVLPLGEAFHSRRLTIRSSQVGRLPPERSPRWTHARRMAVALQLLADPALDVLITGESAFEDLPSAMERLSRQPGDVLCHRIRYDEP